MTLPDWLENFQSFFSCNFSLEKESKIFSLQLFKIIFFCPFYLVITVILSHILFGYFVKIIGYGKRPDFVSIHTAYTTSCEEKRTRSFCKQEIPCNGEIRVCTIIMTYQMNGNYYTESKNIEIPADEIKQNTNKHELIQCKIDNTHNI